MYKTACEGKIIISDFVREHLMAHPEVYDLLDEAIAKLTLPTDGGNLAVEVEMGRIVGRSGVVATAPIGMDEVTTFALRPNRRKPSRVAVGVEGPEITRVVIYAGPTEEMKVYKLFTSYVGDLSRKEPWDPNLVESERAASIGYWTTHALVHIPNLMGDPFMSTWNDVLRD